ASAAHAGAFMELSPGETVKFIRSRTGMKPIVHRAQSRLEHVGVNLRRRKVGVPEHQLNGAQVGAALEQVRGEGVPQDVRAEHSRQAGGPAVLLENLPGAGAAEAPGPPVVE